MGVGSTHLYKTLRQRKDFSESQAYLLAEVAYTGDASLLWRDTYARSPTFENLRRRGYMEGELGNIIVRLTDKGRALVSEIETGLGWQQKELRL